MGNAAPHHLAQEINRCDWIPGWSNPTTIKPEAVALILQRLDFRRADTRGYGKTRKVLCLYASCGLVSSATWCVECFIQRREYQQSEAAVPCPMTNWQLGNEDRGTFPKCNSKTLRYKICTAESLARYNIQTTLMGGELVTFDLIVRFTGKCVKGLLETFSY